MPHILGVIPARYASTRFPGKPLVDIQGKPMIQHVYERASQAQGMAHIVVATDDERIASVVRGFGGEVEMTSPLHRSGTERLTEVLPRYPQATHAINIQGDEPFIHVSHLEQVARLLAQPAIKLATLVRPIHDVDTLLNPNVVKVALGEGGRTLYFSRQPIPFCRSCPSHEEWLAKGCYYKHLGIYGYEREALLQYNSLSPSPLEQMESLEQLRWLAHGYAMWADVTEVEAQAIDTPEDLARLGGG